MDRLLVYHIDDEKVFLEAVRRKLESPSADFPLEVRSFREFREYLTALHAEEYPVFCIIDVDLTDTDAVGTDLVAETRSTYPDTLIVMYSSSDDHEVVKSCMEAGADLYLPKSSSLDSLATTLYSLWIKRSGFTAA